MNPIPSALFGAVSRIFAPNTKFVKLDSPYNRFTNGASGKYVGASVNTVGTVIGSSGPGLPGGRQLPVNAVHGSSVVASTIPGNMLPTGDPIPGKMEACPKFPFPPLAVPNRLVNGGAIGPPSIPKFGPVPPMNGNCTNGCPPTLQGGPAGRNTAPEMSVVPLTRIGASMIAGPLQNGPPAPPK